MSSLSLNHKLLALAGLWLLLAYWSWQLVRFSGYAPWIFLDNLNLIIHEAGHWIFMPLGRFMTILGGSLTQIVLPAIFAGYFIVRRDWAGAAFGIFWVGNNFINVSYYIGDAQAMALPLLGGDSSGHDWHNLLTMTNALEHARSLSLLVRGLGIVCLIVSLTGMFVYALSIHFNGLTSVKPKKS